MDAHRQPPREAGTLRLEGSEGSLDRLMPEVYDQLRRLARRYLARRSWRGGPRPTAIVNETYLRLARQRGGGWRSLEHFLAIAATMMRRVVLDQGRTEGRVKRGGSTRPVPLDEALRVPEARDEALTCLEEALAALGNALPRCRRVVELRFFGGLSVEETAEALGVAPATVRRDWTAARTWLQDELGEPARRSA